MSLLLLLGCIILLILILLFIIKSSGRVSLASLLRHHSSSRSPGCFLSIGVLCFVILVFINAVGLTISHQGFIALVQYKGVEEQRNKTTTTFPVDYFTEMPTEYASVRASIPKILHQTYATSKVILAYKDYIAGCLKLNPGWQYYMWRDADIVAFIKDHFPSFMRKYKHFNMYVQRGDCIRYMVLHHFGGIYLDMDVECVKPFLPSLANHTAFVDQEAREHANILYSREFSAMNSAMGSVRGHPFFRRLVQAMMEVDDRQQGAGATTGPDLLTSELSKWRISNASIGHPVTLLEPEIFSPLVDTRLHNFRLLCARISRGRHYSKSNSHQAVVRRLRVKACRDFARIGWRRDKSTADTVGRHLFLHLGYAPRRRSAAAKEFDIEQLKPDVKFYAVHKMKP